MLELIRNILKFLRHHSYREFVDRIWRAAVKPLYESATRYIVKLDLKSAAAPNPNRDIKELTTADINKMLEVMYVSRAGLQERFSRGNRCFAVLDNDKIVSYFWAQFGLRDLYELRLKFNLSPNQAWMYNAVTVKIARGRGLYPDLIRHMAKALLQSGIDESFIDVDSRNRPSMCGVEKAGCTRVVLIHMKRIFASVNYKLTIFDKEAWQRLSQTIEDFHRIENIVESDACP